MSKPTISVDFDGVLHSYASGWKGARNITDDPVPGAIDWLCEIQRDYTVAISSARSWQWGGRWAMRRWLKRHAAAAFMHASQRIAMKAEASDPRPLARLMRLPGWQPGMDYPEDEADHFARCFVRNIQFPRTKPSAQLYIDDRAHCFTGAFPDAATIRGFKPWNKTPRAKPA